MNPTNGDVYVFINRSLNRIKLLHWERGGMVLYSKVLERGTFCRPGDIDGNGAMNWRDLMMIVEGIMEDKSGRRARLERLKSGNFDD